jgi:CRISPR-associated protein Csm4
MRLPLDAESQKFLEASPKIFKMIKFVSFGIIDLLQRNQPIKLSSVHIFTGEYLVSSEEVELLGLKKYLELQEPINQELLAIQRKIQFHEVIEEQKVGIDRKTGVSKPFIWEKLSFLTSHYHVFEDRHRKDYTLIPGFYFLLDLSKLPLEASLKIKTAISLVKDEGIGGRRSTGSGLFDEVEFKQLDEVDSLNRILERSESNLLMNLSLVYPNRLDLKNLKYFKLFNRSGYIFSSVSKSQRFQDVTFLEEGSIFTQKISGNLVQVASREFQEKFHDVFKNVIGFYLHLGNSEGG